MNREVRYYSDEKNDEFSGVTRKTVTVDQNYVYRPKNFFWNLIAFILYRIIMTPIAWFYVKLKFHFKVVNRRVLKHACDANGKKQSFYLFANHTQIPGDGYMPSMITFPTECAVVVNADNISLPGTQTFMKMIGAVPLPNKIAGMRGFMEYLTRLAGQKKCIVIYPEAHIWPYYTKIRPFSSDSFRFPITYGLKTFCFTVTYQKRRFSDKPNITAYVDGPFEADSSLPKKEAIEQLRNTVYNTMVERSKNSTYEYIHYEYRAKDQTALDESAVKDVRS